MRVRGLNPDLWPYHSKPLQDELLSSWLARVAAGNGLKLHSFTSMTWPGLSLWNRDVDNFAPPAVVAAMAARTGTDIDRAEATTLRAYQGTVFETHNVKGMTSWILPVGVYHRTRRRFGLQCCAYCLRESAHYRRLWRLAFITVCTKHRVVLLDRCPGCRSPIVFHRRDLGDRRVFDAAPLVTCHDCGLGLSDFRPKRIAPNARILTFQRALEATIAFGMGTIGKSQVFGHLYLAGLRVLVQLCSTGWAAPLIQAEVGPDIGIVPFAPNWSGGVHVVEHLPIDDRRRLLALAARLLEDWPERFISSASRIGLTASYLVRHREELPYWYWRVVRENFDRRAYVPTIDEIAAVVDHLRRQGEVPTRLAVSMLLGSREWFRKRRLDHLLDPQLDLWAYGAQVETGDSD
jgi:hypothetical protein